MLLVCYKRCGSCNKAEKKLKEMGIEYEYRHIDQDKPSYEEIKEWHEKSGLDIKKLFNTSGKIYRDMNLKDKLKEMDLEGMYQLLASEGMLVKRPVIVMEDRVMIGNQARDYIDSL